MIASQNIPIIRIGVLQSADRVILRCNESFSLQNVHGQKLYSGQPNRDYLLTIASQQPAGLRYQVRAGIEKELAQAEQRADALRQQGLATSIRTVGLNFEINGHRIDNREHWVVIGDFGSYEEALAFRNLQEQLGEYVIVERVLSPAKGTIQIDDKIFEAPVRLVPEHQTPNTHITVKDIIIGIEFHWQRYEDLDYRGIIEIGFNNQGKLVVINELDLENYLVSVNSSEMTPDCPLELLKAQTVVARNTVLATMGKHHYNTNFHLCSDDHCQCYQGKKREQPASRQAVESTWGQVIMYENEVCDARYSKICGGIMEAYHNVWENRHIPYMVTGIDSDQPIDCPANTEEKARQLIDTEVPAYCNTHLHPLPPKLANLYSTQNLFRWEVIYQREELERLIAEKTGHDIGELIDIIPLERGDSGRLIYIEIVGSKKRLKIGKELQIRRALSKSHLYSSCFYVIKEYDSSGRLKQLRLKGAGWGHGVGLCQVGATVMAMKQIPYQQILQHYYKGTRLVELYSPK
ncbi:MAG: SpoIID/LytB domain-containing protein [candidate division KSB1 bacterium]|nr:SpoIID/LytB domain-containing protein [candidate division KSB1 bacterium]MDZ7335425.1 SpoIID/LytB domain-containing protein [candidate division KSB1 bacterium]MDZ7358588.1 SpoIID/LytB domain-containing protein [candidate division KSB1 bacterium]MDZ7375368.1 SpoIID/LytB domain-containing protein [candidate division KSB1 bacterium]MDZ7401166.1 SpoIID/LytB domain-containing protein [candidate division KSB1 bacterium]